MNNLKWMGHAAIMIECQKALLEDSSSCDVIIACQEKKFYAHKVILSSSSDFFREMLSSTPTDKDAVIIIPDIKENLMKIVLDFIYLGEACVYSINLSDFLETINLLGIKSAISFECKTSKRTTNLFISSDESGDVKNITNVEDEEQEQEQTGTENGTEKDYEYLEVYAEDDKEQYQMESMDQDSSSEFILAETSESSFNITEERPAVEAKHSTYIEIPSCSDIDGYKEDEEDIDKDKISLNSLMQSRHEAFEGAVNAVVSLGMSLQKAATKYNISKTVLWRRVKKHPGYKIYRENPLMQTAIGRLQNGESLKSISMALDIPMSTLHRYKVRLLNEGKLPDSVPVRKRETKETQRTRLARAVDACHNGMSQNHAAGVYGIPKSTLWRHLQKEKIKHVKEEIIEKIELELPHKEILLNTQKQ